MIKTLRFPRLYMEQTRQAKARAVFFQILSLLSYVILVKTRLIIFSNRITDLEKKLIFTDGSRIIDLVLISFIFSLKFLKFSELKAISIKYFEKKKKSFPRNRKTYIFYHINNGCFFKNNRSQKYWIIFRINFNCFLPIFYRKCVWDIAI